MTATVHIAGESLLQSTALIDSDHPAMLDFSLRHAHGALGNVRAHAMRQLAVENQHIARFKCALRMSFNCVV